MIYEQPMGILPPSRRLAIGVYPFMVFGGVLVWCFYLAVQSAPSISATEIDYLIGTLGVAFIAVVVLPGMLALVIASAAKDGLDKAPLSRRDRAKFLAATDAMGGEAGVLAILQRRPLTYAYMRYVFDTMAEESRKSLESLTIELGAAALSLQDHPDLILAFEKTLAMRRSRADKTLHWWIVWEMKAEAAGLLRIRSAQRKMQRELDAANIVLGRPQGAMAQAPNDEPV